MPKVRPTVDIVKDAQKHLTVAKSRLQRDGEYNDVIPQVNEGALILDRIITRLSQENKSLSDKQLSNALLLFEKEQKKTMPKIDHIAAVRAIYNTTNGREAIKVGLSYGLDEKQISDLVKRAQRFPDTNLAKAITRMTKQVVPSSSAVTTPQVIEDDDTINSDPLPDDLKQLLGG